MSHRLKKKSIWRSEIAYLEFYDEVEIRKEGEEVEENLCEMGSELNESLEGLSGSTQEEAESSEFSVRIVRSSLRVGESEPICKIITRETIVSEFNMNLNDNIVELKQKLHEYYGKREGHY